MKSEFDRTYPVHLNGIINPNEYQESIDRINNSFRSGKLAFSLLLIFVFSIIVGTILFVLGGISSIQNYNRSTFSIYYIVGILLTTVGSMIFSFGIWALHVKRMSRLRQVVAQESSKYSSRMPIACSWRLDLSRPIIGFCGNRRNNQIVQLVIDIGRSSVYYNPTQTTQLIFGQQNPTEPPPYSDQSFEKY